jgi:RHS repeat-associated protein
MRGRDRLSCRNRASTTARGAAALLAALAVLQPALSRGAPGDIFTIPAPVIGADPPKAAELRDGDASVATQTGGASYSYPIQVPPGRNGMAPQLALSYSSQGPLYGGLAAGWTLAIPEIREDTSAGRLRTHSPEREAEQGAFASLDDRFVTSLAGGRPLVLVTEPWAKAAGVDKHYRARGDASFARYERMAPSQPFRWRVYTPDGITHYFGDAADTPECPISDSFAPLTRSIDSFGNEISYRYVMTSGECMIDSITYGQNTAAGLGSFAEVDITWTRAPQCSGIAVGSKRDYRAAGHTGAPIITGANKITSIVVKAHEPGAPTVVVHTRTINLDYLASAESCAAGHAAVRLLSSIQESASGVDSPLVALPPITFTYGTPDASLEQFVGYTGTPWSDASGPAQNLGWGFRREAGDDRWPTVEAMMLDVDGDGLLDRVQSASATVNGVTSCRASWQRNIPGASHFGPARDLTFGSPSSSRMPMLRWQGVADPNPSGSTQADPSYPHYEGCALNGQVTAFHNSHPNAGLCHDNTTVCTPDTYCPDGNVCPGPGIQRNPRTYLAYRWMDMDGDGLTDLVAGVHGSSDVYDIIRGNNIVGGQPVGYEPPLFGTVPVPGGFPACPADPPACKRLGSNCMSRQRICTLGSRCDYVWPGLNGCATNAPPDDCELEIGQLQLGATGDPGNTGTPSTHKPERYPYKMCNQLYPWFIFRNRGNGNFSDTPVIKYQPTPLESDSGDSSLVGPFRSSQNDAVIDIDGDGLLDAVARGRDADNQSAAWWWHVWLNDGAGGMGPTRYTWTSRTYPYNAVSMVGTPNYSVLDSSAGLFDMNGDGLQDHWVAFSDPQTHANVALSGGTGFRVLGPTSDKWGELDTVHVRPGSDSAERCSGASCAGTTEVPPTVVQLVQTTAFIRSGVRYAKKRTFDLDSDGRQDVLQKTGFAAPAIATFNQGGQFAPSSTSYDQRGAAQEIHAHDNAIVAGRLTWQLRADLTDLDGDGLPESTWWTGNMRQQVRATTLGPPRLLLAVDNGRGATTTVSYASMHDPSAVEQHPEQSYAPGRPKASPHTQWVVKALTVRDSIANTLSTTSYYYVSPRHGADDEVRRSFRGFEEVITRPPSGAETVQRFSYTPDWSGRLVETIVKPSAGSPTVHTIDKTTWEARTLLGAIETYHPVVTEHFTCAGGQTEATCTGAAAGYTRTTSRLSALTSELVTGTPILWQETGSLLQAGTAPADGDRETATTFAVYADSSTYRVRPLTTIEQHRQDGAMKTYARSAKTWDGTRRVNLTDEVWFDGIDANRAITRFAYDMATGNLLERWKPVQDQAKNGRKTTYTYDARRLFVATEVNELGHQRDFTYEYGTGVKLQTDGPNARTCTTSCPTGATHPVKEQHEIRVDGLGRTIERWDTASDDGSVYTLYQMETTSYVDALAGSKPTSLTNRLRTDVSPTSVWKQETTELDGHGRPITKTIFAQGSAPSDEITTFSYRNDGTLMAVSVPDPTTNDGSSVTYDYAFDSLGRATQIRRPDSTVRGQQSGIDIAYDGLTQTTTEAVGAAGGQGSSTKIVKDSFGRLVEVHERMQTSPVTWAITRYTYGPDDLVSTITDPEGVFTRLEHDLGGRRIKISRAGGRTWKYTYDRNGNLTSEQVPGSPSPITDIDYTTFTLHDDLDRPASKIIAKRGLSDADRALFASNTERFTWDVGPNHKGYLRTWQAFAPGAPTPAITVDLGNDNQGRRTTTTQTLSLAGYPTLTRRLRQSYYLFGGVRSTIYDDQVGGSNVTSSEIHYDPKLLPSSMRLFRTGESPQVLADQTRNVAGLVTRRRTNTTGAMTFVESNLTFDKLGRVRSQVVQRGPGPVPVVRQDFTYFGNDDPRSLVHYLGDSSEQLDFSYDQRHQITGAVSTTPGYFTGAYAYSAGGRFTRVTHAQTITPLPQGSELRPRDINYVYGGSDPEQVTALTDVAGGQPFATYTYDLAGNQTTRTYPPTAESWDFSYDGNDRLRRVTKKLNDIVQGSEEYWYDGDGQRIAVLERDATGDKRELTWFIGDVEAHYDDTGAVIHVYSHLSLGTPVARVDRTGNTSTSVEYQFHGLANTTLAAVAHDGTINASFSYAPFGEVIEATGAGPPPLATTHCRRFNDKHEDSIAQLSYYGFRYYDKILARWTQADPLYQFEPERRAREPRTPNLYEFSRHNPLRYLDPDGREDGNESAWFTLVTGEPWISYHNKTAEAAASKIAQFLFLELPKGMLRTALMQTSCNGDPTRDNSQVNTAADTDPSALTLPKGGAGGSPDRIGLPFTRSDKKEIDRTNAEAHGGKNVCMMCDRTVIPAKKSKRGVSPPHIERQRDHIIPRSKGGPGRPENAQILCRDCNRKKSDKTPQDLDDDHDIR